MPKPMPGAGIEPALSRGEGNFKGADAALPVASTRAVPLTPASTRVHARPSERAAAPVTAPALDPIALYRAEKRKRETQARETEHDRLMAEARAQFVAVEAQDAVTKRLGKVPLTIPARVKVAPPPKTCLGYGPHVCSVVVSARAHRCPKCAHEHRLLEKKGWHAENTKRLAAERCAASTRARAKRKAAA